MSLPLSITPTDIGALTPNTRSEAEAAIAVRPLSPSPSPLPPHHPLYHIHTSAPSSPLIDPQFNVMHQTASSGPPRPFFPPPHAEYPMHRRQSHNYLDAATEAGLPPSACEPPYPTETTAEQVKGNLSRGTTQAVLQKMEAMTSSSRTTDSSTSKTTRTQQTHVAFAAGQTAFPDGEGGVLKKRLSREGERRTSSITVPIPAELASTTFINTTEDVFEKPSFDRNMSWKREDRKRALYQQEKLMEEERRFGKNYGYDSAGEEDGLRNGQF
jgi:hypothetical protein